MIVNPRIKIEDRSREIEAVQWANSELRTYLGQKQAREELANEVRIDKARKSVDKIENTNTSEVVIKQLNKSMMRQLDEMQFGAGGERRKLDPRFVEEVKARAKEENKVMVTNKLKEGVLNYFNKRLKQYREEAKADEEAKIKEEFDNEDAFEDSFVSEEIVDTESVESLLPEKPNKLEQMDANIEKSILKRM